MKLLYWSLAPVVIATLLFPFYFLFFIFGLAKLLQVFLAMDDDDTPIICFLLLEQKKLLCLRLQSLEVNNETIYDIKPDMSWCISAIDAAAVAVTRPK